MMTKNFDEDDDNIKLDDEEDEKLGFHEVDGEESVSELDEDEDEDDEDGDGDEPDDDDEDEDEEDDDDDSAKSDW
jgi:segregation and condensation protein B